MQRKTAYSYLLALAMMAAIGGWMATGEVVVGGRADAEDATPPPAARNLDTSDKPFRVQVVELRERERREKLEIRGRTEAESRLEVRSETTGQVVARGVSEGSRVEVGDVLCELDRGAREARLAEQQARFAQAELDYQAAAKLNKSGFAAKTRVSALKAALDAARAGVREAEIELARTTIRAPVSGLVESPMAELGAMLSAGQPCATLIDTDPLVIVGQVSERDIGKLSVGMTASVRLVSGESAQGTIRFIAAGADPQTRTFRVETQIANSAHALRDGVTAVATVELPPVTAHFIAAGILSLDDEGRVGVRSVNDANRVEFNPVKILGSEPAGIWVAGLPDRLRVITVGQDFVKAGQTVEPISGTPSTGASS